MEAGSADHATPSKLSQVDQYTPELKLSFASIVID
jgi:hypothetical protein